MRKGETGEASIHIAATPDVVYATVSDVTRMGEWSPETVRCEWIDGATGPVVGARFKGSNKRGFVRWSNTPEVIAAEPGKEFAFDVAGDTRWRYTFQPEEGGTRVTEQFEMLVDLKWYYAFAERYLMRIKDRKADLEAAMHTTLGRIKAIVETSS
jgi:hypothetical protein